MTHEIKNKLAQFSKVADQQGILLPEQLEIIYRENWFKLFVPKEKGGLELSLREGLEIEEELACIDGSLGCRRPRLRQLSARKPPRRERVRPRPAPDFRWSSLAERSWA